MALVTIVNPQKEIHVIPKDPTDNLFLSIAIKANCSYILSGDRHLLQLVEYEDIKIIRAAEFVRIV